MKINLAGINTVRKRLADGTIREYHYDRATGKRIKGRPGTAAFSFSRDEAAQKITNNPNHMRDIAELYFDSAEFNKLAQKTRDKYSLIYRQHVQSHWGTAPINVFSDRRIRGDIIVWRDNIANSTQSMADAALKILRILISCAVDRGLLEHNHLREMPNVYSVDRSEKIWSPEQIRLVLSSATPEMQWLIQMALLTLQRLGDLRMLEWAAIQNGRLILRKQEKTNAAVSLSAIDGPLASLLASIPRRGPTILTTVTGLPWSEPGFRKAWGGLLRKAGLHGADLHFHDLRGTGATLIADTGRPFHEIAAMTGHSLQSLNRILPRYVKLNSTHANNAQQALNGTWIGDLQTMLQTVAKNA